MTGVQTCALPICSGENGRKVRAAVGDGGRWGVTITYIVQDAPKGLAHAVLIARDYLGDEPFVMYLGDNLIPEGIAEFVREFDQERPNASILLTRVPNPEQFGVAELASDGSVVQLLEKPAQPKSDLALVGVYLFDSSVHEAVRAITPSRRGELEITDAIQWMVDAGHRVAPHLIKGWWKDTGRLEDLLIFEQVDEAVCSALCNPESEVRSDHAVSPCCTWS